MIRLPILVVVSLTCIGSVWAQNIIVDNTAKYLGDGRYSWTVFLKGDISQVASVQYTLHPTFREPVVSGKGTNFAYSAVGWGEFNIVAKIYLKDKSKKPVVTNYWLRLFSTNQSKRERNSTPASGTVHVATAKLLRVRGCLPTPQRVVRIPVHVTSQSGYHGCNQLLAS